MGFLTQNFNTVDLVKFLEKNLKNSHFYRSGHIEGDIHLELGRQWKVTVFYTFCVKRRVCIFNTKNLYGNNT
jgi:hypothetical protein